MKLVTEHFERILGKDHKHRCDTPLALQLQQLQRPETANSNWPPTSLPSKGLSTKGWPWANVSFMINRGTGEKIVLKGPMQIPQFTQGKPPYEFLTMLLGFLAIFS